MKSIGILLVALAALILCAAPGVQAQGGKVYGTYFQINSTYTNIGLDSVRASAADTLRLARTKHTYIGVRARTGQSGSVIDTLTALSGGVAGQLYIFRTASKDSGVCFLKGTTNLRVSATVVLSDTNDVLALWYDVAIYKQVFSSSNH